MTSEDAAFVARFLLVPPVFLAVIIPYMLAKSKSGGRVGNTVGDHRALAVFAPMAFFLSCLGVVLGQTIDSDELSVFSLGLCAIAALNGIRVFRHVRTKESTAAAPSAKRRNIARAALALTLIAAVLAAAAFWINGAYVAAAALLLLLPIGIWFLLSSRHHG